MENAILGLLRAEFMRNFCFHIEYSLSVLSAMAQGKPLSYSLDFHGDFHGDFQFHTDTTLQSYCDVS